MSICIKNINRTSIDIGHNTTIIYTITGDIVYVNDNRNIKKKYVLKITVKNSITSEIDYFKYNSKYYTIEVVFVNNAQYELPKTHYDIYSPSDDNIPLLVWGLAYLYLDYE